MNTVRSPELRACAAVTGQSGVGALCPAISIQQRSPAQSGDRCII